MDTKLFKKYLKSTTKSIPKMSKIKVSDLINNHTSVIIQHKFIKKINTKQYLIPFLQK